MTNAQPPESIANRLDRLEELLADVGDVVLTQSEIVSRHDEVLTRLEEQTARNAVAIEALTTGVNNLVEQSAADRQQAAIDRQQANVDRQTWQAEIRRIWDYLRSSQWWQQSWLMVGSRNERLKPQIPMRLSAQAI